MGGIYWESEAVGRMREAMAEFGLDPYCALAKGWNAEGFWFSDRSLDSSGQNFVKEWCKWPIGFPIEWVTEGGAR